jgi:hypothetical protein
MTGDRDPSESEPLPDFGDGGLADLPRLRELCQSLGPPEPDEAAWKAALVRLHDGLAVVVGARRPATRRWWAVLGLAASAAVLAVVLARSWWSAGTPPPPPGEDPYPVAGADDVTILSMDARDVAGLVVGEPPVSGDLEFVRAEDVRVIKCKRCPVSGNRGHLEPGEVPMVVASFVREDGEDE